MFIRKLHLTNFKNHEKKQFSFKEDLIAFVGLNGIGKTNILDGIYTLCIGKSYFSSSDKNCVKHEENFYRLEMEAHDEEVYQVAVVFEKGKRKRIIVNDLPYDKNIDHVGRFPAVVVSPNDNVLILGGSEERRKFIDQTLSQIDKAYLTRLVTYNACLKQRNALLKNAEERGLDENLLAIYNETLVEHGQFIHKARLLFIEEIQSYFNESFTYLSENNDSFELNYKSDLKESTLETLLQNSLKKDLILRRTTKGIHKDDLEFTMGDGSLKEFGSQGQQKTFLLALKLTQFNFLKARLNKVPLFIIDDIFDKLDTVRSQNLIKFLADQKGQVFISNTDEYIFQNLIDTPIQIIRLER